MIYKKKITFHQAKIDLLSLYFSLKLRANLEQMRLKLRENLRTSSLNLKFTGSYEKQDNFRNPIDFSCSLLLKH